MRNQRIRMRHLLFFLAAAASLALSACGPGNADATPTMSVDAIYTAAFHTLTVQRATQLALTPSETPSPLPSPTLVPATTPASTLLPSGSPTTSGGGKACNSAAYVSDVTIPDGTVLDPGKNFVKTWTIMNNGTCDWTSAYKLAFVGGEAMGGASVPVPSSVPAGQQVQISVSLIAPANPGNYTGSWQLQNPQGQTFGDVVTVVIKVSGGAEVTNTPGTPAPSATP